MKLSKKSQKTLAMLNAGTVSKPASNAVANAHHGTDLSLLPDTKGERLHRTVKATPMVPPPAHPLDTASAPIATAMGTKAGQAAKLKPSQPRRQSTDAQIKQLKHQIDLDLEYIQSLLRHGKNDKAIARMRWVTMRQDRILELATQFRDMQLAQAVKAAERAPSKPSTTVLIKRKSYKRWADK